RRWQALDVRVGADKPLQVRAVDRSPRSDLLEPEVEVEILDQTQPFAVADECNILEWLYRTWFRIVLVGERATEGACVLVLRVHIMVFLIAVSIGKTEVRYIEKELALVSG